MQLTTEVIGDITVVELPGDHLDADNAKEFRGDIKRVLEGRTHVVFDLRHLEFIDSSGLGALLVCLRQLNTAGGDLKLCNVTKPVRVLFELVRMHRIFEILHSREEAVQAFTEATRPTAPTVAEGQEFDPETLFIKP